MIWLLTPVIPLTLPTTRSMDFFRAGHQTSPVRVTLEGVVLRQSDSDIASLLAKGVFGVFSVTNNLRVKNSEEA